MLQLNAGVAWLKDLAGGGDLPAPGGTTLEAMARALELNIVPDAQRDADAPVPDNVTVTLKNPHTLLAGGGTVLTKLSFRTPSFAEIKRLKAFGERRGEDDATTEMLVMLNEDKMTSADIDRLKSIDVGRCAEKLAPFLVLLRRTSTG
ncbi:hypothetical protein [Reyranella sp.]|uniref:hypothetical protein n=1 Tax=Reyranella sp. TaxID=1929291 RepID=UPI003C7C045B